MLPRQNGNPVNCVCSGMEEVASKEYFAGGKMRLLDRSKWWTRYSGEKLVVRGHHHPQCHHPQCGTPSKLNWFPDIFSPTGIWALLEALPCLHPRLPLWPAAVGGRPLLRLCCHRAPRALQKCNVRRLLSRREVVSSSAPWRNCLASVPMISQCPTLHLGHQGVRGLMPRCTAQVRGEGQWAHNR